MHANNPMCHVSMYNQILSSAAGPCGKCAKLSAMRSLKTLNKDALSSNAGHGDADGITQPNSDARCTGTEDFFQSSSNFKSEDAKTLAEARALTLLRPADTNQNQNPSVFTVHDSSNADTLNATPIHPRREETISSERIAPRGAPGRSVHPSNAPTPPTATTTTPTDATGWNETHRANAMPNARSRRSRVFTDAVDAVERIIERIERIAIRVEPFRELAGLTSYDSSKTERYPESPDGVARVVKSVPFPPDATTATTAMKRRDATMKRIFLRRTLNLARERGLARDGDGAEGDRNHFLHKASVCRVVKRARSPESSCRSGRIEHPYMAF